MYTIAWRQAGISLIEVLVGISIITTVVVAIGFSVNAYVAARSALLVETQASYLVEEGYEVLRAIRNDDWSSISSLTIGETYYLDLTSTTLAIGTTPEIIDSLFYRSFVVYPAYRNSDDDLVASTTSGAVADNGAYEVIISVGAPTGTSSMSSILTNLFAS